MALGLLWLSLALLGALQTQAQDSTPNLIPAPPLLRVPLQPDFQDELVRGLGSGGQLQGSSGKSVNRGEERQDGLRL